MCQLIVAFSMSNCVLCQWHVHFVVALAKKNNWRPFLFARVGNAFSIFWVIYPNNLRPLPIHQPSKFSIISSKITNTSRGDRHGNAAALGELDDSFQGRQFRLGEDLVKVILWDCSGFDQAVSLQPLSVAFVAGANSLSKGL